MIVKIGCVVYVRIPAMLRPFDEKLRKNLHKNSENAVSMNEFLVLFMN